MQQQHHQGYPSKVVQKGKMKNEKKHIKDDTLQNPADYSDDSVGSARQKY